MSSFYFLNFGCRASQADGAALKKQLLQAGFVESPSAEQSHFAILNTCTVTAAADAEARRVIRRIARVNPHCRVLVTGCYAQRAPEEIAKLDGVSWVVGNSHKHTIAPLLEGLCEARALPTAECTAPDQGLVQIQDGDSCKVLVGDISDEFHFAPVSADDRTRPTLKVQDGCNARCSFCIIPQVRGRSRSLAPEKVVEQIRSLESAGSKEVVLSGINLGSYGRDLGRRITFYGLVERILEKTCIARIRLSSIEPMDVGQELIRLVAQEPRMAKHFHVPLQSGSDRILRRMNRRYWTSQYAERILAIRDQVSNCGIGADVMVGFPGETDEDHRLSARFIESLPFTYLHIFPYSSRPATPAGAMPGQVTSRVARDRSRDIRRLIEAKRQGFLSAQVGCSLSALTLDEHEEGGAVALTSNYLKVVLPGASVPPNTLLDVRIGRTQGGILYGYPEA